VELVVVVGVLLEAVFESLVGPGEFVDAFSQAPGVEGVELLSELLLDRAVLTELGVTRAFGVVSAPLLSWARGVVGQVADIASPLTLGQGMSSHGANAAGCAPGVKCPEADHAVFTPRGEGLAVGAEQEALDRGRLAGKGMPFGGGVDWISRVPQLDLALRGSDGQASAVRAEGRTVNRSVSLGRRSKQRRLGRTGGVPQPDGSLL
jgi:hypothetical protein